jgi:hypothetical protein
MPPKSATLSLRSCAQNIWNALLLATGTRPRGEAGRAQRPSQSLLPHSPSRIAIARARASEARTAAIPIFGFSLLVLRLLGWSSGPWDRSVV